MTTPENKNEIIKAVVTYVDSFNRVVVLTERDEAFTLALGQAMRPVTTGMEVILERKAGHRRLSDWRII